MAWNDPPSFNYQQLGDSGKKLFKHRYVSDSKLGQTTAQYHQQPQLPQPATNMIQPNQSQQFYPIQQYQQPILTNQIYQQQQQQQQSQPAPISTQQNGQYMEATNLCPKTDF